MRLKLSYPLLSLYAPLFFLSLLWLAEEAKADVSGKLVVEVIAIEYPPYTSEHLSGAGLSFEALNKVMEDLSNGGSNIVLQSHFLPPARANFTVTQGSWSASFYPPLKPDPDYHWIKLDHKTVEMGLFRLRVPMASPDEVAVWPSLHDMTGKVAVGRQADLATQGLKSALRHTDMELVQVDSLTQGFQLLAKGRVDFVFSEKLAGFLIADYLNDERLELEFTDKPVFTTNIGIWVNRRDPQGEELYQALKNFQPALPE